MENIESEVLNKVEMAKKMAVSSEESRERSSLESEQVNKFLHGELTAAELKEKLRDVPESKGRVYFDTLPEFIVAVRQIVPDKQTQDEILDHENAHALEVAKRGYNFRYAVEFNKKTLNLWIFKFVRLEVDLAVAMQNSKKFGRAPTESELREDVIAIARAPEELTDGEMSMEDKSKIR